MDIFSSISIIFKTRVPELLNEVHRLIEKHKYLFILTGSSSRKLRKDGANLLAGRARVYHMHPLTAIEISAELDLTKALKFGTLPEAYFSDNPAEFLKSYAGLYLKEEVALEGMLKDLGAFYRFLEVASFSQGRQLNLLAISREVGVSRKVVESCFQVLEDLLVGIQLKPFEKRAKRQIATHPKFYYFDAGVGYQLRPKGPLDTDIEIFGVQFETLFLQNLRAIIDYFKFDLSVYFWRTTTGIEVDFIVYGESGLFAFELKSRAYVDRKDLKGLREFRKDYEMARCYLIYQGDFKEQIDNIDIIPLKDILFSLPEILRRG